jgi:hypothetical protein
MAHFAQLDENNVVVNVLVVNNEDIQNLPFPESEPVGIAYLNSFLPPARYVQTSYNATFREQYAGIGYTFLPDWGSVGAFCPPAPYPSWTFDKTTLRWQPPVSHPNDGLLYFWDEANMSWVQMSVVFQTTEPTVIG